MVCIASLLDSMVHHYWAWFVLFHFMLQFFFLIGQGEYCFTFLIGSSLLDMVCIVSLPSLVHPYWYCFYCFTSRFTCSYLLVMVCIDSLDVSMIRPYWTWRVLFHFPHWFILTGHDLHCFTSPTGSSLLGRVCIISLHASLGFPYWPWCVLFHFMLHWFITTGHDLYCFTSCFTGSSLLGMVCIVSFHASLVHHYWALLKKFHFPHRFIHTGQFALFHFMLHRFISTSIMLNSYWPVINIHNRSVSC
jgi:hypothetical protein